MSVSSSLLFDHCLWLLLLMPCLGLHQENEALPQEWKDLSPRRCGSRGTLASCFRHAVPADLGHYHGIKLLYQLYFN